MSKYPIAAFPIEPRAGVAGRRAALAAVLAAAAALAAGSPSRAQHPSDAERVLSIDHYVQHESTVPAMAGETAQLYVRERVMASTLARRSSFADHVVLFVHGAGTPAEVAFDVPYEDYSWMAYLAEAGYDVFAMDMTGYGRSTRPYPMNDPCNLAPDALAAVAPGASAGACAAGGGGRGELTTIASDWDDLGAVVEHILRLRRVDRVSLIGWSLGGPRAGGFAARHPDKVRKLILLAPAYAHDMPAEPPSGASAPPAPVTPADAAAMTVQSHADFIANWDRQVGCANQYDPRVADAVWSEMLASDPVGATWGTGVRRAPRTAVWGWNESTVRATAAPTLLVAAVHDAQVLPERVRALFEDLGASDKVLIDLGCASHNAMWERGHTELFRASLEWLRDGTVGGTRRGVVRLGYERDRP